MGGCVFVGAFDWKLVFSFSTAGELAEPPGDRAAARLINDRLRPLSADNSRAAAAPQTFVVRPTAKQVVYTVITLRSEERDEFPYRFRLNLGVLMYVYGKWNNYNISLTLLLPLHSVYTHKKWPTLITYLK